MGDLQIVTRQYAGRGSKAHHPATLLANLVYGYSTGVFSSRKLEIALASEAKNWPLFHS
jgi:transposase